MDFAMKCAFFGKENGVDDCVLMAALFDLENAFDDCVLIYLIFDKENNCHDNVLMVSLFDMENNICDYAAVQSAQHATDEVDSFVFYDSFALYRIFGNGCMVNNDH